MSTNTFLEFNRDLFLCNTIHDPQNVDGVIPTITDGNLYKKKRTIDPFDNIYVLPKNHFIDKEAYRNGIYHNGENISTTYTKIHEDYVKGYVWAGSYLKNGYEEYIQNLDTYLNGEMDVWVGSGVVICKEIEPTPIVVSSTSTEGTKGKTTIITTPSKAETDKMILKLSAMGLTGIESILKHVINMYNKGLRVDTDFNDIQEIIKLLKKNIAGGSTTTTETTDGTVGKTTQDSTNSTTYTCSVEGGSLVKIDRGFVGNCNDYNLKTICPTDNPQKKENCEICKNFQYRDWYDQNNPTQINLNARYDDATSEYHHMWLQTWNLGIGIMVLTYGIYYQLS